MKNNPQPRSSRKFSPLSAEPDKERPVEYPPRRRNDQGITRRQFLKRSGSVLLGAGMLSGGYAWLWEPRQLDIVNQKVVCPRLPAAFNHMKIVQFSDVHLGFHSHKQDIEALMDAIRRESPDLICFTGDIVDSDPEAMRDYIPLLASVDAPLGKYAILGNHDYWDSARSVSEMLNISGFQLLQNTNQIITRKGQQMAVVGLDDLMLGSPDPDQGRSGIPDDMFTLLLMHEPDYADTAALFPFDLQLSGHSHGGQVRLPLLGALMTPPGSRRYIMGMYEVGERSMPLYVNRGIGETHLPVRFMCKPELTVFTLRTPDI